MRSYYSVMILVVDLVCIWLGSVVSFFKDIIFLKYKPHLKNKNKKYMLFRWVPQEKPTTLPNQTPS
jgi:hypothetical protein